jgi:hypothetical protein
MKRIQDLEGYVLFDHRNSPGVPTELLVANGLPPDAGKGVYEGATYTCGHCQAQVFINSLRSRERHVCRGCMHVICDGCAEEKARTLQCKTFNQRVDELFTAAQAALSKE